MTPSHPLKTWQTLPSSEQWSSLVPALDWLDHRRNEMVRLIIELCNINSGTRNLAGIEEVSSVLQREFRCLDGETEVVDVDPLSEVNDEGKLVERPLGRLIRIGKRLDIRPRVLLCIHMDTVYQSNSPFQSCRYLPDGRLNGPGVADAKGGLVVMLYALKALERSPLAGRIGWEVIINPDEELGSPGSETLLKNRSAAADLGLLFEPTLPDGKFVSWRKGVGNFVFVVRGRSVHSGREFAQGRNAVVACCRLMNAVHDLNDDPEITYNVGRIRGGHALNVVPDLAIGRVNVRVKTRKKMALAKNRLQELADHFAVDGIRVDMSGRFTSPPKEMDEPLKMLQRRVEECGRLLGQEIHWAGTGGASDGNKFAAVGLPNIDTLGPAGGEIHSHAEFLDCQSLVPRAKLAAGILLSCAVTNHPSE